MAEEKQSESLQEKQLDAIDEISDGDYLVMDKIDPDTGSKLGRRLAGFFFSKFCKNGVIEPGSSIYMRKGRSGEEGEGDYSHTSIIAHIVEKEKGVWWVTTKSGSVYRMVKKVDGDQSEKVDDVEKRCRYSVDKVGMSTEN